MNAVKSKPLHFTVCPIWLTNFIRSLWAEGSYQKAFNIINGAFPEMSEQLKFAVIAGEKRLVKDKKDDQAVNVVKDNWKPDLGRCVVASYWDGKENISAGQYPDPLEVRNNAVYDLDDWLDYLDKKFPMPKIPSARLAEVLRDEKNVKLPNFGSKKMPHEHLAKANVFGEFKMPERFGGYNSVEEMNTAYMFKRSIPSPQQHMANQASRRTRELEGKPKPNITLSSEMGWITPDGKFYSCLTPMEHIWLADQFGLTENEAEQKGWIKITRDFMMQKFIFKGKMEPTQTQINTVFDWCEKHKQKLPEWAGGKE